MNWRRRICSQEIGRAEDFRKIFALTFRQNDEQKKRKKSNNKISPGLKMFYTYVRSNKYLLRQIENIHTVCAQSIHRALPRMEYGTTLSGRKQKIFHGGEKNGQSYSQQQQWKAYKLARDKTKKYKNFHVCELKSNITGSKKHLEVAI